MPDMNLLQCMADTLFHFCFRQSVIAWCKCHVLEYRRHKQLTVRILKDVADFLAHLRKHLLYNRHLLYTDTAFVIRIQPDQQFQQRGFPDTIRSNQPDAVIFMCGKCDVLQNRDCFFVRIINMFEIDVNMAHF